MLRKRIIFTLLYSDGFFVLSRNFRLQKVGDLNWLEENYSFSNVSQYIDELIILDVSRGEKNNIQFRNKRRPGLNKSRGSPRRRPEEKRVKKTSDAKHFGLSEIAWRCERILSRCLKMPGYSHILA